ncbi:leucine-rich repeat-containing protein 31 isoform X3 [Struthio camelus]|uniref:leucine-rich repeat-containing protein 31 isoform X3 n=1 Tax=Struthio camelus TaxID=8801 RepID=UPI0036042BDB
MSADHLKEDAQSCQDKCEEDIPKSSPFDFVIKQFQGKKSFPGKRKEQPSAVRKFFRGFDFGKSKVKDRRETEETEVNNSRADDRNENEDLSIEDGPSRLISEAKSPSGKQRFNQFMQKLGKKANSKNLDLNNCALSATDVTELASLLPFLPELEEISLSWNGGVGGTLKALTVELHHVNLLKVLRLNNCRLTAEDVTSLAHILNVIPNLEVLDLSINKHIGCSMKIIAQNLKNVPGLKELNLHMCGLKQDSLQGLDTALQHLAELRKLDISCNKEIGGGFKVSTSHLACLKNLEVLDLHQCYVTEEDVSILSQVIPLLSSLQELNLSSNKNIGVSSDPLLGRLRFLPKLKSVAISDCCLREDSFSSLAEAALHLPELKILDLSWNKCVGGNLKLLLGALKLATEIQVLRLSSCNLVAEDLALLTLLTQDGHLARLRKLDVSYNDSISDEGWAVLCKGLAVFKELSELDVSLRPSSCRDCGMWFSELLAALTKLPALVELGMQRWVLSESQQKQLESFNQDNKRSIRFDC